MSTTIFGKIYERILKEQNQIILDVSSDTLIIESGLHSRPLPNSDDTILANIPST